MMRWRLVVVAVEHVWHGVIEENEYRLCELLYQGTEYYVHYKKNYHITSVHCITSELRS